MKLAVMLQEANAEWPPFSNYLIGVAYNNKADALIYTRMQA